MTLDQFLRDFPQVTVVRRVPGGPVYIANDIITDSAARVALFGLSDYVVSSQSAGCYILIVRRFCRG